MRRFTLLLLLAVASPLAAQVTELRLAPASQRVDHEFTRIGSLRVLGDGRLLVTDTDESELRVFDLRAGTSRVLGRQGAGPNEYRDLGRLLAVTGDSTWMPDASNRRLLLLAGDSIVGTRGPSDALTTLLGPSIFDVDPSGRLLATKQVPPTSLPSGGFRAELLLLRATRSATPQADTLRRLRGTERGAQSFGPAGRETITLMTKLLSAPEQARAFADGYIAVALQDPYRVEWHAPDGSVVRGAAIETSAPPVTDAEKAWWRRRQEELQGGPLSPLIDRFPWASTVTPYRENALIALPDGRLLVWREPWSGDGETRYDVIDRRGRRVARLTLERTQRIVAAVGRTLYVAAKDEDGIERLQLHPVP